jgi:hypothetical protein
VHGGHEEERFLGDLCGKCFVQRIDYAFLGGGGETTRLELTAEIRIGLSVAPPRFSAGTHFWLPVPSSTTRMLCSNPRPTVCRPPIQATTRDRGGRD